MLSLTPQPQPLLMPPNDWAEGKYHLQDRMPVTKDMHDTLASMIAQMNKVGRLVGVWMRAVAVVTAIGPYVWLSVAYKLVQHPFITPSSWLQLCWPVYKGAERIDKGMPSPMLKDAYESRPPVCRPLQRCQTSRPSLRH